MTRPNEHYPDEPRWVIYVGAACVAILILGTSIAFVTWVLQ